MAIEYGFRSSVPVVGLGRAAALQSPIRDRMKMA